MKYFFRLFIAIIFLSVCGLQTISSQNSLRKQIGDTLTSIANETSWIGNVSVRNINVNKRKKIIEITTNETLGYLNFREKNVKQIYDAIEAVLPPEYHNYKVYCRVGDRYYIEDLIPNYYRNRKEDKSRQFKIKNTDAPLVSRASRPNEIKHGLEGRHIAVWASHGYYYNQSQARWMWQRARLMQTVEDIYTQGYVIPFLVPMLENAGANVLIPRERDIQTVEIVVDNDIQTTSLYRESAGTYYWETGEFLGFAHRQDVYCQGENPFQSGTYRMTETVKNKNEVSTAEWIPDITQKGTYAVYVSYKTVENSVSDAHYAVYHLGGSTEFLVNQNLSGGTWVYLGHFEFEPENIARGKVVLSNYSSDRKRIVTADGVKFGGGMGNIARQPSMEDPDYIRPSKKNAKKDEKVPRVPMSEYSPETSNYPRFTEGARYWLQWAGMPDTIYSRTYGENDYLDDLQSRSAWINYISAGSGVSPKEKGLNVPLDLAVAFHSDAGMTPNDSIIGTLGICTTRDSDKKDVYKNGISRMAGRDLADIIQSQIVSDIQELYAPEWVGRGIWDKSYSESRVPEIPTLLLESMSHQNFADMRYGNDPRFRFILSRAIYKGILKYMESVYHEKFIVQPLPVKDFNIRFTGTNEVELNWTPVYDSLEDSADPKDYIIYTRIDERGFDNGILVKSGNNYRVNIDTDKIYSFKVTAVNDGGESFPSEILSVGRSSRNKGEVLVINGFDKISAPAGFMRDTTEAGFLNNRDAGMPYIYDISFTGEQYDFERSSPWLSDDVPGFGASHAQYETMIIAGNTFDYPFLHGQAITKAGYSFVSTSKGAVLTDVVNLKDYKIIDLIIGNQKETFIGNGQKTPEFKTFPLDLQEKIYIYCQNGGNIFVSGTNIASDMYGTDEVYDRSFVEQVLRYKLLRTEGTQTGKANTVQTGNGYFGKNYFTFYDTPNKNFYYVNLPDAIEPVDKNGFVFCRYGENNISAGVASDNGQYKVCALAFPFETIREKNEREELMEAVLNFLNSSNE